MKYIAREQIKELFTNTQEIMWRGLWYSGYYGEGEYKAWNDNGTLILQYFYKDGKLEKEQIFRSI